MSFDFQTERTEKMRIDSKNLVKHRICGCGKSTLQPFEGSELRFKDL